MNRVPSGILVSLLAVTLMLVAGRANAHEFRPSVLTLDEVAPGQYTVRWQPSAALLTNGVRLPIAEFPDHCERVGPRLDCGPDGLRGRLGFAGLGPAQLDVAVTVRRLDGSTQTELLETARPSVALGAGPSANVADVTRYFWLGVEHIASGFDHVLFVIGLTLLVGMRRRLLWTVTAFTAGHAASLAASVLDVVRLPAAPVEAAIALSVLLLGVELVRERKSAMREWPAGVALAFGLVHGLGFAGALREIGLPSAGLWRALGSFNAGIEVGQVAVVAAVLGTIELARRAAIPEPLMRRVAAYSLGSIAFAWLIARVVAFWGVA